MMCAIINKLRAINAAARHRPVFDLRIPVLLYPGAACPAVSLTKTDTPAVARREIGSMVLNSLLTQPLFTRMANLAQNAACASEKANSKAIVTELSQDFLYFSHLLMPDSAMSPCAF